VATEVQPLEKDSLKRAEAALAQLVTPEEFDVAAGEARLAELLRTKA
jgi:hypothetical protein